MDDASAAAGGALMGGPWRRGQYVWGRARSELTAAVSRRPLGHLLTGGRVVLVGAEGGDAIVVFPQLGSSFVRTRDRTRGWDRYARLPPTARVSLSALSPTVVAPNPADAVPAGLTVRDFRRLLLVDTTHATLEIECGEISLVREPQPQRGTTHQRATVVRDGVEFAGTLDEPVDALFGMDRCPARRQTVALAGDSAADAVLLRGAAPVGSTPPVPLGWRAAELVAAEDMLQPHSALYVLEYRGFEAYCADWHFDESGRSMVAGRRDAEGFRISRGGRADGSRLAWGWSGERRVHGVVEREIRACGTYTQLVAEEPDAWVLMPGEPDALVTAYHPDDVVRWYRSAEACERARALAPRRTPLREAWAGTAPVRSAQVGVRPGGGLDCK